MSKQITSEQVRSPYVIKDRKIEVHGLRSKGNMGASYDLWNLVEDGKVLNKKPLTVFPTKGAARLIVKAL